MVNMVSIVGERMAEMVLPKACTSCGGDLTMRVSPDGARTYCPACHVIAKPEVTWNSEGARLDVKVSAHA